MVIAGVAGGGGLPLIILVIIIVILRFKRLSIEHFCLLNPCVVLNLMSIERFLHDLEMKTVANKLRGSELSATGFYF